MSLIELNGRPYIFCPKCKANVVWPASLSSAEKSGIAAEVRENLLAAVKLNHERFSLNLREAKALAFHVTKKHGECHRCHRPLQDEVSVCGLCRSANLDW
jgi:Zn finger protein HypA/HybF involved in hydrogenase expression